LFLSYCETEIETCGSVNIINCDARNVLFNNIYTTSNILMSLCNLFIGILSDKIGLFVPRLITTALFAAGLTLMTFVEENESLIWIAWSLIAMGGLAGHVINLKSCFATPTIKATLMQVLSGAFGTAGSVGWIITLMIDNLGLEFKTVWFIWLTSYLVFAAIKIIFWTPNQIPMVETNDEFSLVENSVLLKCFSCSKTTPQKTEEAKKAEISYLKMVFGDCKLTFNYILVLLGYIAIVVRRQAYTSWFGSGWPEWVAQETDPAVFNEQINEFQSILALAFFPVNILPGLMIGKRKLKNINTAR
jgi:MFS family permease